MRDQAARLRLISEGGRRAPGRAPERIIAVGSGKGGVGKSNIALNLAVELALRNRETCLLDADLGMANASILAGVTPRFTLGHLLSSGRWIDEIVTRGPAGLGIIAGANGFLEMANLSTEQRQKVCNALVTFARPWEYLVIDIGAGISENVLAFMERADHCLVVMTPEPTSMADAFGLIKALNERGCGARLSVVVNRAASIREARAAAERMIALAMQYLNRTVDWGGFLLEDAVVAKAVRSRTPFSSAQRRSAPAQSVARIADCVESEVTMADLKQGGTGGGRWRGWVERLLNI